MSTLAQGARPAPLPTVLAFGTMSGPLAALIMVSAVYLPRYYVGLGLGLVAAATAITAVRAIDLLFDPLLSLAMDRVKTPIGRYRPWLILGVPLIMVAVLKLLAPPADPSPAYLILWLLVVFAGYSMATLALAAWASVLATSYHDRSRLYGWMQGLSAVGQMSILLGPPFFTHGKVILGRAASMPQIGLVLIVAVPAALAICLAFTPERTAARAERPRFSAREMGAAITRPAMLRAIAADFLMSLGPGASAPLFVFFLHDAKGFAQPQINLGLALTILGAAIGGPLWGRIAHRFGKPRTVQIACVFFAACHATVVALPPDQVLATYAAMAGVGFCSAALVPLVRAMVADVADEVRLERRQDLTSLLFSMVTTTQKIGATITVLFVYPILALVGFNGAEGATNTPHAVLGLELCYLLAPTTAVLVGGAMFFGYSITPERHAAVRAALEARDAEAALAETVGQGLAPSAPRIA